jgi:DNA-binding NarL/FixJ family response regulator
MRAILAGPERERDRLRRDLAGRAIEVAAEFATVREARASRVEADVIVTAAGARPGSEADDPIAVETLTTREVQVLELLAEGLSNRRIAERLAISDQTVKFHLASIMGKLGTSNRVETVRRAVRRGIIAL